MQISEFSFKVSSDCTSQSAILKTEYIRVQLDRRIKSELKSFFILDSPNVNLNL